MKQLILLSIFIFVFCSYSLAINEFAQDLSSGQRLNLKEGASIIEAPTGGWPEKGTLLLSFNLEDITSTVAYPARSKKMWERHLEGELFSFPLFSVELFARRENAGFEFKFPNATGAKDSNQTLLLSRLDGAKTYWLALAWDIPNAKFDVNLNGVQQGDMRGWGAHPWTPVPGPYLGDLSIPGFWKDRFGKSLPIHIQSVTLLEGPLRQAEISELLREIEVVPLTGEARTVYTRGLSDYEVSSEPLFAPDFAKGINWVNERSLFDGDTRISEPSDDVWVLEGNGIVETDSNGALTILTDTKKPGDHSVLWLPGTYPENFILEYGFTPHQSRDGLHIVFFCASASGTNDEGVHGLSRMRRDGIFKNYFAGDTDSYHASVFAAFTDTGYDDLRLTANLRKNNGFSLVAVGNDRVGGIGKGPHHIRILKKGGLVQVETDGILSIEFEDDGMLYGPVLDVGAIGLRLMGHSGGASFENLKIFSVE